MIRLRRLAGWVYPLAGACVILGPLAREIAPGSGFFDTLAMDQMLAAVLTLGLVAFFARQAARAKTDRGVVLALCCAAAAGAAGVWIVAYLGTPEAVFLAPDPAVVGVSLVMMVLVLVAGRQVVGWPLVALVAMLVAFGYLGQFLGQGTLVPDVALSSYITYLVLGGEGRLGRALDIIVNFVLFYLFFGVAFDAAGGGQAISRVALRIAGHSRSHAIKACVVASGLFGMASGTATSNVMTSGAFSLPAMRRIGVRNETAAGIEAAASTAGQLMPPVMGAAAFVLADFVNLPYGTVALAGVLPALACYLAFFRQADRVPLGPGSVETTVPEPLRWAWLLYILPPLVTVALLMQSSALVGLAALAGTAACLMLMPVFYDLATCRVRLWSRLEPLMDNVVQLIFAAAIIGLLLGMLQTSGLSVAAALAIGQLGQGSLVIAVVLTALAAFVMGLGVAMIGVYIIVASTLTPGLIEAGMAPLVAHFFVFYCGTLSMITPPVAFAALAASTLAKAAFGATARAAMGFGWILYVMPFLIVLRPGLLGQSGGAQSLAAMAAVCTLILSLTENRVRRRERWALSIAALAGVAWQGPAWASLLLSAVLLVVLSLRRA